MGTDLSITAALQKSLSTAHGRVDTTEPISHTIIPSIPDMAFLVHVEAVFLEQYSRIILQTTPRATHMKCGSLSVQAVSSKVKQRPHQG